MTWNRPVPLIGDQTSAAERANTVDAWAFHSDAREAFYDVVGARRDIRRYRPDEVPSAVLDRVFGAAHIAPSVGHSQDAARRLLDLQQSLAIRRGTGSTASSRN